MKRHGSFRRKTRHKLSKHYKTKGKISLRKYFQEFKEGDGVILKAEPAHHKGMYFPRFHGKQGKVIKKRGESYEVSIKDGKKLKIVVVHPVHLKRV